MKKIVVFILSLYLAISVHARDCDSRENIKKCLTPESMQTYLAADDIYFNNGSYAGQLIDQTKRRPVALIPELENDEAYYVKHFFNQGKFWVAEIPKVAVKSVIFQLALFDGPLGLSLAHAQLRFLTDEPVRLFRLKDNVVVKTQTNDFIFTIQAALPANVEYNARDAFIGNFKIVSRLVNSYDRAALEEIKSGDVVTQHQLINLSQLQKDLMLKAAVEFSSENLLSRDYIGTSQNCISITFDIIDKALQISQPRVTLNFTNFFLNGPSPNETMSLDALRERNLIGPKSRIENYKL
jgi:hypothetical protein